MQVRELGLNHAGGDRVDANLGRDLGGEIQRRLSLIRWVARVTGSSLFETTAEVSVAFAGFIGIFLIH